MDELTWEAGVFRTQLGLFSTDVSYYGSTSGYRFIWPKLKLYLFSYNWSSWKLYETYDPFLDDFPSIRLSNNSDHSISVTGMYIVALQGIFNSETRGSVNIHPSYYNNPNTNWVPVGSAEISDSPMTLKVYHRIHLNQDTVFLGSVILQQGDPSLYHRSGNTIYWEGRPSDDLGNLNPDSVYPIYQKISFSSALVIPAGESAVLTLDIEFTDNPFPNPPLYPATGSTVRGGVFQWYPVNSLIFTNGLEPEPPGPGPDPGRIPYPSECFETSFVRLFETGGSVFESAVNRFLYSDSEMSSSIYGPKKRFEYGGNRPWIKVKNITNERKAIKDIYISVIQGTAHPEEGTSDYGIALYDLVFGRNPAKIYTPDASTPYEGTLTVRLRGNLGCRGTAVIPMSSRSELEEDTELDASYWKNRPSDAKGNWYPDTGSQTDVPYYHVELSEEIVLKPGAHVYFEVTCDWDLPLPEEPLPDFPIPIGWTARWGYVFQWYCQNSCRVKMYEVEEPSPEPEPEPEPIASPYLSYEIGHGRQSWAAGLDRVLLNHGGADPFWDSANSEILPCIKFTNTSSRTVYVSRINIKCVNGCTVTSLEGGESDSGRGINFKGESGVGQGVDNYSACLYGDVRPDVEGGETEHSARATLTCTNQNLVIPEDLQGFPEPDGAYWGPRPVDKEGNPNPDKVYYPDEEVPSADLIFDNAVVLKPGGVFFLDLSCVWQHIGSDAGIRHCLQLFHVERNKEESRIVTAFMAVKFTWDANGGSFTEGSDIAYTYPTIGSIVLPNEYPIPVRENYLFLGWDKAIPKDPVNKDQSFRALWLRVRGGSFWVLGKAPGSDSSTWYQSIPWYSYTRSSGWEEHTKAKKLVEGVWVEFPESEP